MRQQDKIGVPSLGARPAQPELIGGNGLVRILGPAFHQFGAAIVNADETKNGVAFENKRITRADATRFGGIPCFQLGRASCRERVSRYVQLSVVDGSLKKKTSNERNKR